MLLRDAVSARQPGVCWPVKRQRWARERGGQMAEAGVYGNYAANTGKLCGKATERQFRQYGGASALRNKIGATAFGLVAPRKQHLEAGVGCVLCKRAPKIYGPVFSRPCGAVQKHHLLGVISAAGCFGYRCC